ncbi:hypothetical protein Tco_0760741 [Tanacetum coccineum]
MDHELLPPHDKSSMQAMMLLRTSSNSRSHATVHDGQIITETVQRRAPGNVGNTGNRGTQNYRQMMDNVGKRGDHDTTAVEEGHEGGTVLDAVAESFLADVESFMANVSSISGTNGATTSQVNKVHTDANQIFNNVNHLLTHEMHQEEHLDSDVESDIDGQSILDDSLVHVKSGELRVCTVPGTGFLVPAEELATQKNKLNTIGIFDELDTEYERCVLANKNLKIERKNLLIQNDCLLANCLEKDICSIVLASDIVVPPSSDLDPASWKDVPSRNLQTQINLTRMLNVRIHVVRIQNDGFKVENENVKRRYKELSETNTHSRDELTGKITALTAENAKLKTE